MLRQCRAFVLPGQLLSATSCPVDFDQIIKAGVVTLAGSLRVIAAGGLIIPKLHTNKSDGRNGTEVVRTAGIAS